MNHKEWALKVTGDSLRGIARSIGVNQGNFSRQIQDGLSADRVIAIAHACYFGGFCDLRLGCLCWSQLFDLSTLSGFSSGSGVG